ncbi:MAG: hypothetical protein ABI351_00440, partial [Herbaspirillum sp.]
TNAPTEQAFTERLAAFGLDAQELGYGINEGGNLFEYHATLRTEQSKNTRQLVEQLRLDPQVISFKLAPTSD